MIGGLLAVVDIFVESNKMDEVINALYDLECLEQLYEVTGEFDVTVIVSASDIDVLRETLKNKIMKIDGVKSIVSSIVLNVCKGPRAKTESSTQL